MNHPYASTDGTGLLEAAVGWFLQILPFEFGRYFVVALAVFLLTAAFAGRFAGRKIREDSPKRDQMAREIAASVRTSAIFAIGGILSVMGSQAGFMKAYDDPAKFGWAYFWGSLGAVIILHDAWFYWTHRLIHDPRLFRRIHRLHHKSHNPSPWTAYSFNTGEAAINAAFLPLLLLALPVAHAAIFLFLAHMIVRNVIGHSGYEWFPSWRNGRPVFDWLTTVTHHDLHHAQAGWNYGLYFTFWDRMMKTEHPLYREKFAAAVRKPLDGSAVGAIRPAQVLTPVLVALAVLGSGAFSDSAAATDRPDAPFEAITGIWASEGHGAHIALDRCASDPSQLCGRLVWSWDPAIAARQGDALMLGAFVWNGDLFHDGWLSNPEDGRTYRGKIKLASEGALELEGCALVFCKRQIWRRVDAIPGCQNSPALSPIESA